MLSNRLYLLLVRRMDDSLLFINLDGEIVRHSFDLRAFWATLRNFLVDFWGNIFWKYIYFIDQVALHYKGMAPETPEKYQNFHRKMHSLIRKYHFNLKFKKCIKIFTIVRIRIKPHEKNANNKSTPWSPTARWLFKMLFLKFF